MIVPHRDSKDVFILGGTDDIQVWFNRIIYLAIHIGVTYNEHGV